MVVRARKPPLLPNHRFLKEQIMTKSSIQVLDPKPETVHVIDRTTEESRTYTQRELSLHQMGALLELLAAVVLDPASGIDLDEVISLDLSTADGLSKLIGKVIGLAPTTLSRLIAVLLNAPDDAGWLLDNLGPSAAVAIIRRGMVQNDLPKLIADFFSLQAELTTALRQARSPK
jgi:hypothetical protein